MDSGWTMNMFQPIHLKAPPGPIPDGLKVTSLADPNRLDPASSNPVLAIGSEKARLYLRAILNDLLLQRRNLPDSRWLLRVGIYLELLTCVGLA